MPRAVTKRNMESKLFWNTECNLLTVVPPDYGPTKPHVIIPVVDVSASMDAIALVKNPNTKTIVETKYTILDLVKYSLKVIAHSLSADDMIGLVSFADTATMVMEPIHATEGKMEYICDMIDSMKALSTTNIWAGLKMALNEAKQYKNVSILLFTDGVPNMHPALGYDKVMADNTVFFNDTNVHVFTYGYDTMDVNLMAKIASNYNGMFNYISDASMIGTVFVHTMANILSQASKSIRCVATGVELGQLNYGQRRHFILPENPGSLIIDDTEIPVDVHPGFAADVYKFHFNRFFVGVSINAFLSEVGSVTRDKFYSTGKVSAEVLENAKRNFWAAISKIDLEGTPDLKQDVFGEIKMAFDNYNRWGKYYLWSIHFCHEREWCNNFLDKGTQRYATGMMFKEHLKRLEKVFEELPVQKPTGREMVETLGGSGLFGSMGGGTLSVLGSVSKNRDNDLFGSRVPMATPITNMKDTFMNAAAGCVGGGTQVIMEDGSYKFISKVKRGDCLYGGGVVENVVKGPPVMMLSFPGKFRITPYHPIQDDSSGDKWVFPINLKRREFVMQHTSWNLVVSNGFFFARGSNTKQYDEDAVKRLTTYKVIGLGHGIVDDPVATHPYLGSEQVKNDIAECYDEKKRLCVIRGFKRDNDTGLLFGVYKPFTGQ